MVEYVVRKDKLEVVRNGNEHYRKKEKENQTSRGWKRLRVICRLYISVCANYVRDHVKKIFKTCMTNI